MKNVLIVVDMEEQYLTDDDIMGLLDFDLWEEARQEIRGEYIRIIAQIAKMKNEGWFICFTGETEPYGELKNIVDEILPYWYNNKEMLRSRFEHDNVHVCGIFFERCVKEVQKCIPNSLILKDLSISHNLIGDPSPFC